MDRILEQALRLRDYLATPVYHPHPVLVLAILIVVFAINSRAIGKGVMGARSAGSVALLIISYLFAAAPGMILALGWAVSRVQDFKPGAATPTTKADFERAAARQKWVLIAGAIDVVIWQTWAVIPALAIYMAAFLAIAGWYGAENADAIRRGVGIRKSLNTRVELGQGACMGAAVWFGVCMSDALIG